MKGKTIRVLVDDPSAITESSSTMTRAARPSFEDMLRSATGKIVDVEVEVLRDQIKSAYDLIVTSLSDVPEKNSFHLDTVSFTLSIDASGGISLVSTFAASTKTQAGLTFTISRNNSSGTAMA